MSTLFTFTGVLSATITFVFAMFILRPITYFHRIVLVAFVVVIVVFLYIGICYQQSRLGQFSMKCEVVGIFGEKLVNIHFYII